MANSEVKNKWKVLKNISGHRVKIFIPATLQIS
ncbi:hypothetical protein AI2943V1_1726 [Klebsiella oxytoca]|nr:hypothetical protein AI2943V1_1726 [Klebsiella oxytoca]CAH5656342.1 hypothetical protein AI2943V1_1726 [Klebsiella oxytoca]